MLSSPLTPSLKNWAGCRQRRAAPSRTTTAAQAAIGLRAYFCDPHSPWGRASIENAHGRIRRDLPRKTSLRAYTDADINDVIWNLNATPRKCLGYRTPIEAFAANLGVALET
jgi:IS30 family transposase